jgi:hypothetical protein
MIIKPMPSPGGTNREKLFILQGGKGVLNRRSAYDSRRGLAYDTLGASPNDNIEQIVAWAKENLTPKALHDLSIALQAAALRAGYPSSGEMAAADDGPARVGMDAAAAKSLDERFGLNRIGWA